MMEEERSEELKMTHTENSGTISERMQEEEYLPLCVCVCSGSRVDSLFQS